MSQAQTPAVSTLPTTATATLVSPASGPVTGTAAQAAATASAAPTAAASSSPAVAILVSKRHARQAEDAYLAGAKKLQNDDLSGAEREFARALKLNSEKADYALAILLARQHRVTELVQQATKARATGDPARSQALLAQARAIDPDNPMVLEHDGDRMALELAATGALAAGALAPPDPAAIEPWKIVTPSLASAIHLQPKQVLKSFHQNGTSEDLLRTVASAYGIRAVMDDSVERKGMTFNLNQVSYEQAMGTLMQMAHVFAVPIDEHSVEFARDTEEDRGRLQRQLEETIYLGSSTSEEINDVANVARSLFGMKMVTVLTGNKSITLRAPEEDLGPLNRILQDLLDRPGEVMIEVKLFEVYRTGTTNMGASLPTSAGVYNVDAAAASLVSANSTLVKEGIAQGIIKTTDSDLTIAGELIASGLVTSSLFSSTVGVFGKGTLMTGITETGSVGFNFGLNTSDTRMLDDMQIRIGNRQDATFREGSKYPIMTSTYSVGSSSSSTSTATINGVNVSKLLSQYTSGSSSVSPQVTYEDLGLTLDATPTIEKSGRIDMKLGLKIEALSGSTNDGNPILNSRLFKSTISVREGESVLMVSNVNHSETAAMTGLPGLSELPGFQLPLNDSGDKDASQLIVMVTPRVVQRRSDLLNGMRIAVRSRE